MHSLDKIAVVFRLIELNSRLSTEWQFHLFLLPIGASRRFYIRSISARQAFCKRLLMTKKLPTTGQPFRYGLIFNRYAPVMGLK